MKRPEQDLQKVCLKWFRLQYPKTLIFHPPNGGFRSKIEAAILKGIGVVSGVPDLVICHNNGKSGALFIEMKAGKGVLSDNQKEIMAKLAKSGYQCYACNSLDRFMDIVNCYMKNIPFLD